MIQDVLDYMQTQKGIYLQGKGLAGNTLTMNTQVYKDKNGLSGTIVCYKNGQGWPVDTFPFDNIALCMGSTENGADGWQDAGSVKIFTNNVIFCPRDIGNVNALIANYSGSNYNAYLKSILQFNAAHNPTFSVNQIVTQIRSIGLLKNFGGVIGQQQCLIVDYYWNYPNNRETYYFVKTYGLVQWEHANLVNNAYVIDNQSIFNTPIKTTVIPTIVFPVGNILGT